MRDISAGDRLRALIDTETTPREPGTPAAASDVAPRARVVAVAELPTRFGAFHLVAFQNDRDGNDHLAMVHGDVIGAEDLPTRVHSECLTGDVMGSLRCDCRDQLEELRLLARQPRGLLLYLRQEGRGIGLVNKLRAYALQEQGLDTVEANLALGFRDDERDYAVAASMLDALGVRSIHLMTNNPTKLGELTRHGVRVTGRIAHAMPPNVHNRFYLETKARRSGHMLDMRPGARVDRAARVLTEARLLD
ncbi:MAG: GTP cyclohydrolase II [Deltaproteobacteria bacterium]|nr:GTP cyclohydrolase II [Deltaproteobacteria bacterium]